MTTRHRTLHTLLPAVLLGLVVSVAAPAVGGEPTPDVAPVPEGVPSFNESPVATHWMASVARLPPILARSSCGNPSTDRGLTSMGARWPTPGHSGWWCNSPA